MFICPQFPVYRHRLPSAGIPCHSSLRLISSHSFLIAALSHLAGGGAMREGAGFQQQGGGVIRRRLVE